MLDILTIGSVKTALDTIVLIKEKILPNPKNKARNYEMIVEPTFSMLQPVVDDYFIFFRRAAVAMNEVSTDEKLQEILGNMKIDWEKMITSRGIIRASADEILKVLGDEKYKEYFERVIEILTPFDEYVVNEGEYNILVRNGLDKHAFNTSSGEIYAIAASNYDFKTKKQNIIYTLNAAISNLETKWVGVARSYMRLRFDYLRRTRM